MNHIDKNITAAILGLSEFERIELRAAAEKWARDKERPRIPFQRLAELAFVEGWALSDLPVNPGYTVAAQSKAWAAAALLGAIYQISAAYHYRDTDARQRAVIAELQAKVLRLTASCRAAWRATDLKVPFRQPRPMGSSAYTPEPVAANDQHHDGALRGRRISREKLYEQRPDLKGDAA